MPFGVYVAPVNFLNKRICMHVGLSDRNVLNGL